MINLFLSSLLIFSINTGASPSEIFEQKSLLDPTGSYMASQVERIINTHDQYKNCPELEYSLIKVTENFATINEYKMPFEVWNKGEDEYWSLGEINQTSTTFHYQTRGMLNAEEIRNFKLIYKAPRLFHLYLTMFIPFEKPDTYGVTGEICRYKMEIIKNNK